MERKYYTCPVCEEQKLRYAVIDIDGTNLEEGYCCESCGETFIGLDNTEIVELNPEINNDNDMTTVKCKKCGSANVEVRAWVNPNTEEVSSLSDIHTIISEQDDYWCKECEESVELIIEDSKESNTNLLADIDFWWQHTDDEDREVVSGLDSDNFSNNEQFQAQCEIIWSTKTEDQKIEIYRTINYRD